MNPLYSYSSSRGNCRVSLHSSRVRRNSSAEDLEAQWRELRRYATIDKDSEQLLGLISEFDQRKRQSDAVGGPDGK